MGVDLPEDWSVESGVELEFVHTAEAPLDASGHWKAVAGSASVGESTSLVLASFVPVTETMSIRFVLRQSVGSQCETGQLYVLLNGTTELPVPCGYHAWRPVTVDLPVMKHTVTQVAIRFDAHGEGGSVELDDIRLMGHCQPVDCATGTDCPSTSPCATSYCGSAYTCESIWADNCCVSDSDCPLLGDGCGQSSCVDGQCKASTVGGCNGDACLYESLDEGLPNDWHTVPGTSTQAGASAAWSATTGETYLGAGAMKGVLVWPADGDGVGALSADIALPPLLVGGGLTSLAFQLKFVMPGADCLTGAVELWMQDQLVWMDCGANADWTEVRINLGPWVGDVVTPILRIRGHLMPGTTREALVDDVRGFGSCVIVECLTAADCDDMEECTQDVCMGYNCGHLTVSGLCDDGDQCTVGDACQQGMCVGSEKSCDDSEPCTSDQCVPNVGCVHQSTAQPCDDGDACTAGDHCADGQCVGSSLLCTDYNGCTRDVCTDGVGCEYLPEPFGMPCSDNGALHGLCWDGACVGWDWSWVDEIPSRAYDVARRDTQSPLRVVGQSKTGDVSMASLWHVDHQDLSLSLQPSVLPGAFHSVEGDFLVGTDSGVAKALTPVETVDVGLSNGIDLWSAVQAGNTLFIAGDGHGITPPHSTVLRCPLVNGGVQNCSRMAIVQSPSQCAVQPTMHVRDMLALSSQKLLVAGFSVTDTSGTPSGHTVARVAIWDGNTETDCGALGVYSGEIYLSGSNGNGNLAVDAYDYGVREIFHAIDATGPDNIWVGGTQGRLVRYDGAAWSPATPESHPASSGWNVHHDVHGLVVTETELHAVGDGVGAYRGGCRDGFYLHASRVGDEWIFDHLTHFHSLISDCGQPPFLRAGLRGIHRDPLTHDLVVVGWSIDPLATPGLEQALIMRLEKP